MDIGILEFKDNEFTKSIILGLAGLDTGYIRIGELTHPSLPPCRVVVDRVSFCDPFLREVMRYWSLAGAYVLNDPFYTLTADKLSDLLLYDRLGIPHPRTVLLPRTNATEDVREMVAEPDWRRIFETFRFPCILKPVDGYGWQDVFRVDSLEEVLSLYEALKGKRILILQELIAWNDYYRVYCVNAREAMLVKWSPRPFDLGEYSCAEPHAIADVSDFMVTKTIELNKHLGLDFNCVEWCITPDRKTYVIDSYNDVPDVRSDKIPPSCYAWIVERLCACVREKLASGMRNGPRPSAAPDSRA